ncbi:hypothetical protein KKC22_06385 [Myxococcota bacterium]|nr:hypothetical protein [Myxococcota bacterium]
MMRILNVLPLENHTLAVTFAKVRNGGYFVEWENGADLSADTLFIDSRETPDIKA